jgi:hypothetical protein
MKRVLFFIGVLLFFTACKKMDCCMVSYSSKISMTAQKNGGAWSADTATASMKNDTITLNGNIPNSYLKPGPWPESISISVKYSGSSTYSLSKNQVIYVTQFGPDAVPSFLLNIDTTFNNTLTITNYDQVNNIISGTFNLKFINNSNPSNITYITFSDGKFLVPLKK